MIFILILFVLLFVGLVLIGIAMKAKTEKQDPPEEHPKGDEGNGPTDDKKQDASGGSGGHTVNSPVHSAEVHQHGNPVAAFLKELLRTWYIGVPIAIVFVYWISSPVTWRKYRGEEVAPAPNYLQFDVKAQVAGTDQISFYKVHAFGPDYCRFDSVFNTGMFFDWNPMTGDGTCGYYGGGAGKLKVKSISKPTPLSFVIMAERQKQGSPEEWELMTIEGKSSL